MDHPIRATRQFQRICGWLGEATARLGRGAECVRATNNSVALAPAYAGDAPGLMIDAVARWIDAAGKLEAISNRWDDSFTALIGYVESGTAPLDLSELYRRIGSAPARIRLIIIRRPSLKFLLRTRPARRHASRSTAPRPSAHAVNRYDLACTCLTGSGYRVRRRLAASDRGLEDRKLHRHELQRRFFDVKFEAALSLAKSLDAVMCALKAQFAEAVEWTQER